jgi:peptidoglycan/xylan/chitin deacetylase (PgdA/CDA1 family)/SAM-dependent methyltransferase
MPSTIEEVNYWEEIFSNKDPWNYTSDYEQTKYKYTIEMLSELNIITAVELGCAEGHFTEKLAPRVSKLLAVDISERALVRAQERCVNLPNVCFAQHDIGKGVPEGKFDLMVCSEILYYLRDRYALQLFAKKAVKAMNIGGYLILTHANMVSDDRTQTGFDFNEIGAKFIGEIFSSKPELEFIRELQTQLYRIQLFRRKQISIGFNFFNKKTPCLPREIVRREANFEHPAIKWGGCAVTASEARHCWITRIVPIFMYHRIADDGPSDLAPYRVSPVVFERQLAYLQRHGYNSITLDQYSQFYFDEGKNFAEGRIVIFTFDDAYLDFYENAWPLLKKYCFNATVFVPTDYIGGFAQWDEKFGQPAPIMSWDQIVELKSHGVSFGAHSCSHRRLGDLSTKEVLDEAVKSKTILEHNLGIKITGYSHPYNEVNQTVTKNAGYLYAVGCNNGNPPDRVDQHNIPRIEIFGQDSIDDFIAKIPPPEPAGIKQRTAYYRLRKARDRATYMMR